MVGEMALPFIGTGTTTTGAAGAGTTIAGATASTILAGAGIGISALAATQGLYDTFANPDGVVYGEDGQIRDYTRSAKIGAWLTGSQLTPIENLTYTPLKASSSNVDVTQLRKELTANANNPEKQLALLTKFFATAEGKQLLAANGLPGSVDELSKQIQGQLDSGKSTEEVFQHFLATIIGGGSGSAPTPGEILDKIAEKSPTYAGILRQAIKDAREEGRNERPPEPPKDPKWKKILNVILIILATATGGVAGAGVMREFKNAQIRSLEATRTRQIDNLDNENNKALLSASILRVKSVFRRLADDSPSLNIRKDLASVQKRIEGLTERFNADPSEVRNDAENVHNFLVQVATKHVRERVAGGAKPENVVFEITKFMSDGEKTKISAVEYNDQNGDTLTNTDGSPKLKDPAKLNKAVIDAGSFLVPSSSTTSTQK